MADAFAQADARMPAIETNALGGTDDAGASVDACVDQGGDENINLVILVGAARLRQISQISE
jgi:hypothetical protein